MLMLINYRIANKKYRIHYIEGTHGPTSCLKQNISRMDGSKLKNFEVKAYIVLCNWADFRYSH